MTQEDDILTEMKRSLYKHGEVNDSVRGSLEKKAPDNVSDDWHYEEPVQRKTAKIKIKKPRRSRFVPIFFGTSALVFTLAAAYFFYTFFWGGGIIQNRVDMEVDAPSTVRSGEALDIDIVVRNRNSKPIENALITVDFPPGTKDADGNDIGVESLRAQVELLGPGEEQSYTLSGRIFGKENTEQEIVASFEYGGAHSSATFVKERIHEVVVSSAPVTLIVSPTASEIESGKEFEIEIKAISNSATAISDVAVEADFPFGYVMGAVSPEPEQNGTLWLLGDMQPKEQRTITLQGVLEGLNSEGRSFEFTIGTWDRERNIISQQYAFVEEIITIREPLLTLGMSMLNGSSTAALAPGELVQVNLPWKNNFDEPVTNIEIKVPVSTNLIIKDSITPRSGFYDSSQEMIIFNRTTNSSLAEALPGDSGTVSFSFRLPGKDAFIGTENPQIKLIASISGKQPIGFQAERLVENNTETIAKISDDQVFEQTLAFASGPFNNIGSLPAKVGEETTFTVTWNIKTGTNPLQNVLMSADLPIYVDYLNVYSPESEILEYDPLSKRIIWRAGDVAANTSGQKQVSFQIVLKPSASQIGQSPLLLKANQSSGQNAFTGTSVSLGNADIYLSSVIDGNEQGFVSQ